MPEPHKAAKQTKQVRLVLVGELYKKGYTFRAIRDEVIKQWKLETYSLSTVKKDVDALLTEWRKTRIEDVDMAIQLELDAINDQIKELWIAWERSKTDQTTGSTRRQGIASKSKAVMPGGEITEADPKIQTTSIQKIEKTEINFGDPRYQDLINKLRMERRKLLGLYAVDKSELTLKGSISPDKWLEDNMD